jgi:hypothetical protein
MLSDMDANRLSQLKWIAAALLGAGLILAFASWFDTSFVAAAVRKAGSDFDPVPAAWAIGIGYLVIGAAILAMSWLAGKARSLLVGLVYLVLGLFFAFLGVIIWIWAASINGAPPLLPGPIADFVSQFYQYESGPLNAVAVISGGMALVGGANLVSIWRDRPTRAPMAVADGPVDPD